VKRKVTYKNGNTKYSQTKGDYQKRICLPMIESITGASLPQHCPVSATHILQLQTTTNRK